MPRQRPYRWRACGSVEAKLDLIGEMVELGESGPASRRSTERCGSSDSRLASTAPADPAPMMITSYCTVPSFLSFAPCGVTDKDSFRSRSLLGTSGERGNSFPRAKLARH